MFLDFLKRLGDRRRFASPHCLILLWFGFFVLVGSVLLWLPVSQAREGQGTTFLDAAFTAVSAACVTGLTVVNIAETFSPFGQAVIFLLLETGGLGIMTFAHLGFRLLGMKTSIVQQSATAQSLFHDDAARAFARSFRLVLGITLSIQAAGAVALLVTLVPRYWSMPGGLARAVWSALFHSVSAFCNGGFTLYRDHLDSFVSNVPFLAVLLALVVLGGLGNTVLVELSRLPASLRRGERGPRWISLHTRVVLVMTGIVVAAGLAGVFVFGVGAGSSAGREVFMVVSGRTAGFGVDPVESAPLPTVIILITLMFIGGSPGSCAGGIKTTSLAIWFARIKANLRHDTSVVIFGYAIAPELVSRARVLMALTMLWNLLGVYVLVVFHPAERLETLIFEQVSAFGTVGLSMDFTSRLETFPRLWIMLSMFVGRLGPLSIALWAVPTVKAKISRPVGRIMVG